MLACPSSSLLLQDGAPGSDKRPWFKRTEKLLDEVRSYEAWKSDQAEKFTDMIAAVEKSLSAVPAEMQDQSCCTTNTSPDSLGLIWWLKSGFLSLGLIWWLKSGFRSLLRKHKN